MLGVYCGNQDLLLLLSVIVWIKMMFEVYFHLFLMSSVRISNENRWPDLLYNVIQNF